MARPLSALAGLGNDVLAAALPIEEIDYGPWLGYRSVAPAEEVPRAYATSPSLNYLWAPIDEQKARLGYWRRRNGIATRFDAGNAGLLPAKWGARARHLDSFSSPSLPDGLPTPACLFTKETIALSVDDGRFGQFWLRDQVNNVNYTLGCEYSATTYPNPGTAQKYKGAMLWYESGDGGMTRGETEYHRRFLTPGGRRWLRVGDDTYFCNLRGTPLRWRSRFNYSTAVTADTNRWAPAGPLPPLYPPTVTVGPESADGPFYGGQRFYVSLAFRYADGHIGPPCLPRAPQPGGELPNGYGLITLPGASTTRYASVTIGNIQVGYDGVIERIVLRGPSIDSSLTDDPAALQPRDLRPWEIVKDNSSTTKVSYAGDDIDVLESVIGRELIHFEHAMMPRGRYLAGGDQRVAVGYCAPPPTAIIIAPVGRAADYDLNVPDTDAAAYNLDASYMKLELLSGADGLFLGLSTGAAFAASKQFLFATYSTLQKLVDAINATSFAANGLQWRAQVAPGVNPDAATVSALVPSKRTVGGADISMTLGSNILTRAAGGLSKVAVGAYPVHGSIPAGTYITRIVSDTELHMSANAGLTSAVETVPFVFNHGQDTPYAAIANSGWIRVIAGSLPGFLYFTKTYLDQFPVEKSTIKVTAAGPLQPRVAANAWTTREHNSRTPSGAPGICVGLGPSGRGFVVAFADSIYAYRNERDGGSGEDKDYQLVALNENEGCCSWASVYSFQDCVHYAKPGGIYCADLFEETMVSGDVHLRAANLELGDLRYEVALSMAATAGDGDGAHLHARSLRDAIWVAMRRNAGDVLPRSQLCYDHSLSRKANGLRAALQDDGTPWGWSTLLTPNIFGPMGAVVRADGLHLYTMDESNAGSTGDGKIVEFETGDTDDGSEISAELWLPLERMGGVRLISPQEVTVLHKALTGALPKLYVYRGRDVTSDFGVLDLSTHAAGVAYARDVVPIPFLQRAPIDACRLRYYQQPDAASPTELRHVQLRAKRLPSPL